ncbi:MAG: sigma-54 dependent transcriptional regulator [Porphyromonas sp.]|nr:sigma-54 dependent transcriptional regulator [Porphyromonas sp.]
MSNRIDPQETIRAKQRFGIFGNAPGLDRAIEVALLIAPTDVSVLVTGESGVGKESFPQIIHYNSVRKHGPFVAVNCGAIPEGTIDSELFGHMKGSFTDAVSERKGYFEVADGGTIFLDEIGELPLPTQARLLRVLESGEFMKVGSSQIQRTDIRVVAATNRNLEEAVKEGKFREDLLYRLNTVTIELPPLRDRGKDIELLFRKFASDFSAKYKMPPVRLDDEALELLLSYDWPGNIRQLRNLVERLSVIMESRVVTREDLKEQLPTNADVRHPVIIQQRIEDRWQGNSYDRERHDDASLGLLYNMISEMRGTLGELTQLLYHVLQTQQRSPQIQSIDQHTSSTSDEPVSPRLSHDEATILDEVEEIMESKVTLTLEEMEQKYIELILKKNNGVRKKTAEDLGISERTLYRKLSRD